MSFCFINTNQGLILLKKQSKQIAVCGITVALGVIFMLLGSVLGLGMYLVPMLIGMFLTVIGRTYGKKFQILLWLAISLLSFILVASPEQNLMFLGLFGWYPIMRSTLQKLSTVLRVAAKFLIFNFVVIGLECLLILVLFPEALGTTLTILLLILGNITFFVYDLAIPRFEYLAAKHLKKIVQ